MRAQGGLAPQDLERVEKRGLGYAPTHNERSYLRIVLLCYRSRRLTCMTPPQSGLAPKVHLISTAGIARYMHSFPVHVHYWPRVSASYISPCTRLRVAVVSTHLTRSSEGSLGRLGGSRPGIEATTLARTRHPPRDTQDRKEEVSCRCCHYFWAD
jgi:hypothetical protein